MNEKTYGVSDILNDGSRLYGTEDVQKIYGVGKSTVEQWRLKGIGPKFIRLDGSRLIRYRREDIIAHIEGQTAVASTTDADQLR